MSEKFDKALEELGFSHLAGLDETEIVEQLEAAEARSSLARQLLEKYRRGEFEEARDV